VLKNSTNIRPCGAAENIACDFVDYKLYVFGRSIRILKSKKKTNVMPNLFRHPTRKVSNMQVCYMHIANLASVNICGMPKQVRHDVAFTNLPNTPNLKSTTRIVVVL
jgi:hypothetical protein